MIYVLLPAYNEEQSFPPLLPKLKQTLESMDTEWKIVICNDGSKDSTQQLIDDYAKEYPIECIAHRINRGLGETIRDLMEWAAENTKDSDTIIRMDCDDTHEPKYIPQLVNKLNEGYDVVIASRFAPGGDQKGVNLYRSTISMGANLFMTCVFQVPGVKEYSCGYRAYKASIIKEAVQFYGNSFVQLKGLGFTGTLEKLIKLKILGAKFAEVGFVLRYDQKVSDSKMVSSITTLGYMVMAVCYHWPWSGWKNLYSKKLKG